METLSLSRRCARFPVAGGFSKKEALTKFRKTRFGRSLGKNWHFQDDREHSVPIGARGSSSPDVASFYTTPNRPYTYHISYTFLTHTVHMFCAVHIRFSSRTHQPTYSSYPVHTPDKHLPNSIYANLAEMLPILMVCKPCLKRLTRGPYILHIICTYLWHITPMTSTYHSRCTHTFNILHTPNKNPSHIPYTCIFVFYTLP